MPDDRITKQTRSVLPDAFAPKMPDAKSPGDTDGLSLYRKVFHSPEEVARKLRTGGSRACWIAQLRASDLLALGLTLTPDPLESALGHALIKEIRAETARSDEVVQFKRQLAQLVTPENLLGPYDPPTKA